MYMLPQKRKTEKKPHISIGLANGKLEMLLILRGLHQGQNVTNDTSLPSFLVISLYERLSEQGL